MSALPPKADMCSHELDVCFVPSADIGNSHRTGHHESVQSLPTLGDRTISKLCAELSVVNVRLF
jgi:hypothetical protein